MKVWKKKMMGCVLAGLVGLGTAFGAVPASQAEAGGVLVDVLGTAIAGTMYRDKVMGVYKTYNNTDKGRQEWFEHMKEEEGVVDNEYLNSRLDTIMANVTAGIGPWILRYTRNPIIISSAPMMMPTRTAPSDTM